MVWQESDEAPIDNSFVASSLDFSLDSSRIEQKLGPYKAPIPNGE